MTVKREWSSEEIVKKRQQNKETLGVKRFTEPKEHPS